MRNVAFHISKQRMLQPSSHQDGDKGASAKLSAAACGSPGSKLSFEEAEAVRVKQSVSEGGGEVGERRDTWPRNSS